VRVFKHILFVTLLSTAICCGGAMSSAQQIQLPYSINVIEIDPSNGLICVAPIGRGPCELLLKRLAEQARTTSLLGMDPSVNGDSPPAQLVIIGVDPTLGPICLGPLGPGPCEAIQQYLASKALVGGPNSVVRNPSQIWGDNNSAFNNPNLLLPNLNIRGERKLVEEKPWGFCPPPCARK